MHPITDEAALVYARSVGRRLPLPEARARAELAVSNAVEAALRGGPAALDTVRPVELERIARDRYRGRVAAGEAAGVVLSGSSGLPLSPIGTRRSRAATSA